MWTWPNEEAVADPNINDKNVNYDTIAIDILNGNAVSRTSQLAIQGAADGSTTAVLTLNNASSLTVDGRLAIGGIDGTKGQIDILGGSTVTTLGDGGHLRVVDNDNTWGLVNIVDSNVVLGADLYVDQGEGHVNISGTSVILLDDIILGGSGASVGFLDITGPVTLTCDEMEAGNNGEGHITIGGEAVIIVDDLNSADGADSLGFLDIGGTATVDADDDIEVADDGEAHVTITGDAVVRLDDDLRIADKGSGKGFLTVSENVVLDVGDDFKTDDGEGHIVITDNVVVDCDDLFIVDNDNGTGSLEVSGNATVRVRDDLVIVDDQGGTGSLVVSGLATVSVRDDYRGNDDSGNPSTSTVTIDGGTVHIASDTEFADDNPGPVDVTIINGGSWICDDDISIADNRDSNVTVTITNGRLIAADDLNLGDSGGDDIGQIRIFLNGGILKAKDWKKAISNSQIIYTDGVFQMGVADVNEVVMQQLITDGTIVVDGIYHIVTVGETTVLSRQSATQAKLPEPFDGEPGVLLGTTLSWAAGDGAVTHDVYFGTTNPPALIGNQAGTSYYPGPIELGTTYYWQVDEVQADGTTVPGDIWSFTTTSDVSTVNEVATQPNPADGATDVPLDTTLTWWPGATAVSHDGYIGASSPPPLLGNTTEIGYDATGLLEPSTTYYWQVDAIAADGTVHTGDIWSFTTSPGEATEPDPADFATSVALDAILSWRPGATAATRDVYFGTTSPPPLIGNQADPSFDPGPLAMETTYYWKVDEIDAAGKVYPGAIWMFKTPRPGTGTIRYEVWITRLTRRRVAT
ncbi:MAG: hypothetical protein ACYTAO_17515 [Planctomycetota bacterium]